MCYITHFEWLNGFKSYGQIGLSIQAVIENFHVKSKQGSGKTVSNPYNNNFLTVVFTELKILF